MAGDVELKPNQRFPPMLASDGVSETRTDAQHQKASKSKPKSKRLSLKESELLTTVHNPSASHLRLEQGFEEPDFYTWSLSILLPGSVFLL